MASYDLSVSCPVCGVEDGVKCVTTVGRPMHQLGHKKRAKKAERIHPGQQALDLSRVTWS